MTDVMTGGCLCGAMRYRIEGTPRLISNCHCSLCRRAHGAPFVTWLTVRADRLHVERGELNRYKSSDHGWRAFCPTCGTQVLSGSAHYARYVEVSAGSLDEPGGAIPERQVFWPDRLNWVTSTDGLPCHVHGANSERISEPEGPDDRSL